MNNFDKWEHLFRTQNLYTFNHDSNGILWLKVRAISRSKQLSKFIQLHKLPVISSKVSSLNREVFEILERRDDAMNILDKFLQDINNEWYERIGVDKTSLKEDLYRVRTYSWGGDQNNSMDRYLT